MAESFFEVLKISKKDKRITRTVNNTGICKQPAAQNIKTVSSPLAEEVVINDYQSKAKQGSRVVTIPSNIRRPDLLTGHDLEKVRRTSPIEKVCPTPPSIKPDLETKDVSKKSETVPKGPVVISHIDLKVSESLPKVEVTATKSDLIQNTPVAGVNAKFTKLRRPGAIKSSTVLPPFQSTHLPQFVDCNDFSDVIATSATAPTCFYIIHKSSLNLREDINSYLAGNFGKLQQIQKPSAGSLVAAKIENKFVRGKVFEDEGEVFLCDDGLSTKLSSLDEVRQLPQDLSKIPDLCQKVKLPKLRECDEMSVENFNDLMGFNEGDDLDLRAKLLPSFRLASSSATPVCLFDEENNDLFDLLQNTCDPHGLVCDPFYQDLPKSDFSGNMTFLKVGSDFKHLLLIDSTQRAQRMTVMKSKLNSLKVTETFEDEELVILEDLALSAFHRAKVTIHNGNLTFTLLDIYLTVKEKDLWRSKDDNSKGYKAYHMPLELVHFPSAVVDLTLNLSIEEKDIKNEDLELIFESFNEFRLISAQNDIVLMDVKTGQNFNELYTKFLTCSLKGLEEKTGTLTSLQWLTPEKPWFWITSDVARLERFSNKMTENISKEVIELKPNTQSYNSKAESGELCVLLSRIDDRILASRVRLSFEDDLEDEVTASLIDMGSVVTVDSTSNLQTFAERYVCEVLLPFPGTEQWTDFFGQPAKGNWQNFLTRKPFGTPCTTQSLNQNERELLIRAFNERKPITYLETEDLIDFQGIETICLNLFTGK